MQLKKFFAIFLAATLILSVPIVPVGAVDINTFEVGVVAETTAPISSPTIYNVGDDISVKISADQNTGISLLKFSVNFNSDALEFVDYATNNLFENETITVADNYVVYNTMLTDPSDAKGDMFTLNFKVKEAFCGDVEIYAEVFGNRPANCKDGDYENLPFVGGKLAFGVHSIDTEAGVVTEPTCVDEGYTTYHCALCDQDVKGFIVPANGHTEAEAVEENRVEPDCVNDGSYDSVVYCSVCDEELSRETIVIDALGHSEAEAVEENRVEPDCVTEGSYDSVVYCSVCDEELSRENIVIDANGHTAADAVVENRVEPDCENEGSYDSVVYCSVCDEELSRETIVIEALGHDLKHTDAKAPTCTEIGWDAYDTCQREGCGYTTYVEKPANGHAPLDAVEENRVEADCENAGSYDSVVYCSVCDEELSRETIVIEALGHTEAEAVEENRVEPDCENAGSYDSVVYCSVCDEELSREAVVIDALGHDLKHTDAKAPTCTEIGWDAYDTCQREGCGYTTYVEKPANGHSYGDKTVVEPEYKVDGYSTHTCTVCNHEEKFDITPALTYILGDVNADERIDSNDAVYLLYNTLFGEDYPTNQKADFNGDGSVDSNDAVYLLYYTLFGEDYPLSK